MTLNEQIKLLLIDGGWNQSSENEFFKTIKYFEESGMISDGTRTVYIHLDVNRGWLKRVDGWGHTIKYVDLKDYQKANDAIVGVLAD